MDKNERLSLKDTAGNVVFTVKYMFHVNRMIYMLRFILMALQILSTLLSAFSVSYVLNQIADTQTDRRAVLTAIAVFAMGIFALSLLKRFVSSQNDRQTEMALYQIRLNLGKIVSQMQYSDVEDPRVKDFISLASSTKSFSEILDRFTGLVSALVSAAAYAAVVLYVQPLILVLVVVVVAVQTIVCRFRVKNRMKWRAVQSPLFRKLDYLHHLLSRPQYGKEIRINHLQDYFLTKTNDYLENACMSPMKMSVFDEEKLKFTIGISKVIQKFLIYIFLAMKVVYDNMRIGDFTLYLVGADNLTTSLTGIVDGVSDILTSGIFAGEFRYCMALSEERRNAFGSRRLQLSAPPSIEFRDVSFKYPDTDKYVLKHVSFKIDSAESLSLVGVNGSGKTTIVKLLCRFYTPTEGDIFINGINTKEILTEDYDAMLGIVFQDFRLFSFTVRENIVMGDTAEEQAVLRSIKQAGLDTKIAGLDKGLDTFVYKEFDESGIEFSGGEGQKLAIARTIFKDAPIIILDEPTAALDPLAEYDIYRRFFEMSGGKTSVFISHRLSSARFTSKIAVLDGGELCEFGTHRELMELEDGMYRNMFEMQAQYYRE